MNTAYINLQDAMTVHQSMLQYRNAAYINLVQQINTRTSAIIKDDMGSQFLQNCGRDLAGEVVRNFFDTSDYNITVDQLATRILKFRYDDEYDPLAQNGDAENIRKNVYNYSELSSAELDKIAADIDQSQVQLFTEDRSTDRQDSRGKKAYRESQRDANGDLFDDLTHRKGTQSTVQQNGKTVLKSDLHADHIQSREAARYNSKYITHDGVEALREFWSRSMRA